MTAPDDPPPSDPAPETGSFDDPRAADPSRTPSAEVLRRLATRTPQGTRYAIHGEIARGGMGVILRVRDVDLRRDLAMKVMLGEGASSSSSEDSEADPALLTRFLEEAQLTGQLDHPGIVPVHELGLDADGRVYFTMRLVKGRELKEILEGEADEDWSRTRTLGVFLRICETLAYAHEKGVIHRDLKPANVMVGRFGEVYVMDWGLAKVLDREDDRDLRVEEPADSVLRTVRRDAISDDPDSPLMTVAGTVVGTPTYMSPEQASGRLEELGPRSDVYAVGAMLYHLLAGHQPYVKPGERVSPLTVLNAVRHGPPQSIHEIDPTVPPELVAICEKAMARQLEERYASMADLAEDLRRYLENRVVRAHRTGALIELKKWVSRNRLAAGTAAAALVLVAGLTVFFLQRVTRQRDRAVAAERNEREERRRAEREKEEKGRALRKARALALVTESRSAFESDPVLAVLLAREAVRIDPAPAAQRRLREALWSSHEVLRIEEPGIQFHGPRFCPKGERFLAIASDHTVRIWGPKGILSVTLRGHEDEVTTAEFSPSGERVLTVSLDGTARVWTPLGTTHAVLRGVDAPILSATFIGTRNRILTTADESQVRLWDGNGVLLKTLRVPGAPAPALASPSGLQVLVSGFKEGECWYRVWDADGTCVAEADPPPVFRTTPRGERGEESARGGSGDLLVGGASFEAGSFGGVGGRIVDKLLTGGPREIDSIRPRAAFFTPDGTRVLNTVDWSIRSLDGKRKREMTAPLIPPGDVDVIYSHGGKVALLRRRSFTPGATTNAWLWTAEPEVSPMSGFLSYATWLGPFTLVAGSLDEPLRVWRLDRSFHKIPLPRSCRSLTGISGTKARRRFLTTSADGSLRLWRLWPGERTTEIPEPPELPRSDPGSGSEKPEPPRPEHEAVVKLPAGDGEEARSKEENPSERIARFLEKVNSGQHELDRIVWELRSGVHFADPGLVFTPWGVLSVGWQRDVWLWSPQVREPRFLERHDWTPSSLRVSGALAFSTDRSVRMPVVAARANRILTWWKRSLTLRDGQGEVVAAIECERPVEGADLDEVARRVLAWSRDHVECHDLSTGRASSVRLPTRMALFLGEGVVLLVHPEGELRHWEPAREAEPRLLSGRPPIPDRVPASHRPRAERSWIGPDGSLLTLRDGQLLLLDAKGGIRRVLGGEEEGYLVGQASFSRDGTRLLAACSDATVRVYDDSGELLASRPGFGGTSWDQISSRGDLIVSLEPDGHALRIWEPKGTTRALIPGRRFWVRVSPSGRHVLTHSRVDERKELLDLDGRVVARFPHDGEAAFSPDGARVAFRDGGLLHVYELEVDALLRLADGRLSRGFTDDERRTYAEYLDTPTD
jgi:serine/threonine protein kinase/WD40 repeat protein